MDKSDVIALILEKTTQDSLGVIQKTYEKHQVYCAVNSVTANEFFSGGEHGLNPQFQITINRYDYNDEKLIEYNGVRYTVYRTYFAKNDNLELYVEKRKGNED